MSFLWHILSTWKHYFFSSPFPPLVLIGLFLHVLLEIWAALPGFKLQQAQVVNTVLPTHNTLAACAVLSALTCDSTQQGIRMISELDAPALSGTWRPGCGQHLCTVMQISECDRLTVHDEAHWLVSRGLCAQSGNCTAVILCFFVLKTKSFVRNFGKWCPRSVMFLQRMKVERL